MEEQVFYASPTKLSTFLECPRHYWFYYLNPETQFKKPNYPYFTMGHCVHQTLKFFFLLDPRVRTKEKLFQMLEAYWKPKSGKLGGFKNQTEEDSYKQRATQMLENFFAKEDITLKPIIWKSNTPPKIQINPNLVFNGVFDRLDILRDDSFHVIDYKTGKEDAQDLNDIQLPMYALSAKRQFSKNVTKASFLNLESGNWDTKTMGNDFEESIISRVVSIVERIPKSRLKEDFVCPQGNKCRHCDYLIELGLSV